MSLVGLLAPLLLPFPSLATPDEEIAAKLRVAWASQYEWREDSIGNLTLDFAYTASEQAGEGEATKYEGTGHVVVADGEVVRVHLPDAEGARRESLREELDWVIARFVRKPFEEQFKEVRYGTTSEIAGGATKIPVDDKAAYFVKQDRIVGMEVDIGTEARPFWIRVDYTCGPMGGGYGILEEASSYTRNAVKTMRRRVMTLREGSAPPAPETLVSTRTALRQVSRVEFRFEKAHIDVEHAIVLDPEARKLVLEAWDSFYRFPAGLLLEGTFQRKLDRDLMKARWNPNVKGRFQVFGADGIEVVLDDERAGPLVRETCIGNLRWAFGLYRLAPFADEFKGCGFRAEPDDKDGVVVRVFGHPTIVAFRIEDRAIEGRLDVGANGSWWEYKTKRQRDGVVLIERMTREIDDRKRVLEFRHTKAGGQVVPRSVCAPGESQRWGGAGWGVVEYRLSRLKAALPK